MSWRSDRWRFRCQDSSCHEPLFGPTGVIIVGVKQGQSSQDNQEARTGDNKTVEPQGCGKFGNEGWLRWRDFRRGSSWSFGSGRKSCFVVADRNVSTWSEFFLGTTSYRTWNFFLKLITISKFLKCQCYFKNVLKSLKKE